MILSLVSSSSANIWGIQYYAKQQAAIRNALKMLWSQPHPQKRCSSVVSRIIFSPAVKLFEPCGL